MGVTLSGVAFRLSGCPALSIHNDASLYTLSGDPAYFPDMIRFVMSKEMIREAIRRHRLPATFEQTVTEVYQPLAAQVASWHTEVNGTLVLGINGAQGTGKSTMADFLTLLLKHEHQLAAAVISIDDLYLTKDERLDLSESVHPLFITRGVPGTHDVDLGVQVIESLKKAGADSVTTIPRFDKGCDDRHSSDAWGSFTGRPDVIIFEGWCIGASAQETVAEPINDLERAEDAAGQWRGRVNEQLSAVYPALFGQIDRLIMLRPPSLECVIAWRTEQEEKLAARLAEESGDASGVMDAAGIQRFVMHYERVTRHQWDELPKRADVLIDFDEQHRIQQVRYA